MERLSISSNLINGEDRIFKPSVVTVFNRRYTGCRLKYARYQQFDALDDYEQLE